MQLFVPEQSIVEIEHLRAAMRVAPQPVRVLKSTTYLAHLFGIAGAAKKAASVDKPESRIVSMKAFLAAFSLWAVTYMVARD